MRSHLNILNEEYLQKRQVLSSLVLNLPYKTDSLTTAPKVSKLLTFPFGIKINAAELVRLTFQFISSMTFLMTATSLLILCIYLPVQYQNDSMLNTAKVLTNEKYSLLANVQEASNYNRLFTNSENLKLNDVNEIIYVPTTKETLNHNDRNLITLNKYPSVLFSGF